jgi:hypothetical protein
VATDSVISKDAVGTLLNPSDNVGAELWPEEAKANAVLCLVFFRVRGGGRGMVSREDVTAKLGRNDDEEEGTTISRNVLPEGETTVGERDRTGAEVLAVSRVD